MYPSSHLLRFDSPGFIGVRGRRGIGVLPVIVVVLLMILALVGFAQRILGSQVTRQTYRLAMGKLAEQLAESAVEEGLHHLRKSANDPGSVLFRQIRGEVYSNGSGPIPLDVQVPETERLAVEPPFKGFFIEDVRADIVHQGQFSRMPYEKHGLVRCRARASIRLGLTEKISRTVETAVDLKVALISTPRPFDQTTVYIQDGASLDPSQANRRMDQALRTLESYREELRETLRRLDGRKNDIRPSSAYGPLRVRYEQLNVPTYPSLHRFEEENLTLFRVQDRIDLKELDLPEAVSRFEADRDRYDTRLSEARRRLEYDFTSQTNHSIYLAALGRGLEHRKSFLQWLLGFQTRTAEYSGQSHARLSSFDYKFDLLEWKRKAFQVIQERRGDPVGAQLLELRKRLGRLNGVILVDNPTETLTLDRELRRLPGLLVLVATGRVRLVDTNRGAGADDLLTVIAYGPMTVEGEVHASLISRNRISIPESAKVVGNLILRDLTYPASLRGVLERDGRYHSGRTSPEDPDGAFVDYYYAAIGPKRVYQVIER